MSELRIEDLATPVEDVSEIATPIDATPASMEPGPAGTSLGAFNEGTLNELLSIAQGASPVTRSLTGERHYRPLGTLITVETELGPANTTYQIGPDEFGQFDPGRHVVFSEGGRLNVYQRSPEMEESGAVSGLGRLLGLGLLAPNRPVNMGSGLSSLERGVNTLDAAGVTPTVPLASPGTGAARTAQITRAVPFAGAPVERGLARTRTEVEQAVGDVATQYGSTARPVVAGETLREQGDRWLKRWRTEGAARDKRLAKAFDDAGVKEIELQEFRKAVDSPFEEFDNPELAEQFSDAWFERWREVLENSDGVVSVNDFRALRRRLGKMLEKPMVVSDHDRGQLKALYSAISSDLERAARQGGGDDLVNMVRERNAYWADGFDRIEKSMKHVLNDQINAEKIFNRVVGSASEKGAQANMRFLRDVRDSIGPEAWNDLASSVLVRMGTGPGGSQSAESAFNPNTFLTSYRNMSPEARKLLFSGHEQAARNLDRLTRDIVPTMQRIERLENVSQSGNVALGGGLGALGTMGIYTGDLLQVLGAIGTGVGANAVSRMLMNPRFTRWLARTSTAAKNAKSLDPQFWARQVPRLRPIVAANPELQPALDAFEQKAAEGR